MNGPDILHVNDVLQVNPDVLILHGLKPKSNDNGVLSPFAQLDEKLAIIIGLKPQISTFSINLAHNSSSGFYAHSGLIIGGGQVVNAAPVDNITKVDSITSRTYLKKSDPTTNLTNIVDGVGGRPGISNHNEINIINPSIGGLYVLPLDEDYRSVPQGSYGHEEVNDAAKVLQFPVYLIMSGGLVLAKFQDGQFVPANSDILKSNEIPQIEITEDTFQYMRNRTMERSPFDINKVGLPDSLRCMNVVKGMMLLADLTARRQGKIENFIGYSIPNIYQRRVVEIYQDENGNLMQSSKVSGPRVSLIPEVSRIDTRQPLVDLELYPNRLGVDKEISQENFIEIILSKIKEFGTYRDIQEKLIGQAFGVYLAADKTGQSEFAQSILKGITEAGFGNNWQAMVSMWQSRVGEDGSFRLRPEDLERFQND